jgi:putative SOS response-associated peptidase YedK
VCGRFARTRDVLHYAVPLDIDPGRGPSERQRARYNVAPGTDCWIAHLDADGDVAVAEYKWSFPTPRGNRINVRSETAHRVPEYREPFDRRRCVVFADGFYEPKGAKTVKNRPWYYFRPTDRAPLYLGGIVGPDGFSILTRAPVEPVASIHDRSPVMVPAGDVVAWLDPDVPGRDALREFAPASTGEALVCWRVGDAAKRAANDGPELIEPRVE